MQPTGQGQRDLRSLGIHVRLSRFQGERLRVDGDALSSHAKAPLGAAADSIHAFRNFLPGQGISCLVGLLTRQRAPIGWCATDIDLDVLSLRLYQASDGFELNGSTRLLTHCRAGDTRTKLGVDGRWFRIGSC
jgi:hypothetical protein